MCVCVCVCGLWGGGVGSPRPEKDENLWPPEHFFRSDTFPFFPPRFYLFIWENERAWTWVGRVAEGEGEADSLLSKEPMWGSIPGPWDHDLSQRQMLNLLELPRRPCNWCFPQLCRLWGEDVREFLVTHSRNIFCIVMLCVHTWAWVRTCTHTHRAETDISGSNTCLCYVWRTLIFFVLLFLILFIYLFMMLIMTH